MRISIRKSKNFEFIYIIKDIYSNGSRTTKTIEKLGKINELCSEKNLSRDQVIEWAQSRAKKLTADEKNENSNIIIPFSSNRISIWILKENSIVAISFFNLSIIS